MNVTSNITFESGIGQYAIDYDLPEWAIAAEVKLAVAQLRSASSIIITSCIAETGSNTISIRCSNISGSVYTGTQSVNIVMFVQYYR